eukprot:scaffold803_cov310-Pinguiococcus_pyrenoidosus.AAC.93
MPTHSPAGFVGVARAAGGATGRRASVWRVAVAASTARRVASVATSAVAAVAVAAATAAAVATTAVAAAAAAKSAHASAAGATELLPDSACTGSFVANHGVVGKKVHDLLRLLAHSRATIDVALVVVEIRKGANLETKASHSIRRALASTAAGRYSERKGCR